MDRRRRTRGKAKRGISAKAPIATPPLKLSRLRMAVLLLRLARVALGAVVRHGFLVVICWVLGTSLKEVRRQARLQALIGQPPPR